MSHYEDKIKAVIAVAALRCPVTIDGAIARSFEEQLRLINTHHGHLTTSSKPARIKDYYVIGAFVVPERGIFPLQCKVGPLKRRKDHDVVDGSLALMKACRRNRDAESLDELDEETISLERAGWILQRLEHAAIVIGHAAAREQYHRNYGYDSAFWLAT